MNETVSISQSEKGWELTFLDPFPYTPHKNEPCWKVYVDSLPSPRIPTTWKIFV